MINLEQAKKIAKSIEKEYRILVVTKITNAWLFSFGDVDGNEIYCSPLMVSEIDGKTETIDPLLYVDKIKDGVIVEDYRLT